MPRTLPMLAGLATVLVCGTATAHDPDGRIRSLSARIAKQPKNARLYLRRGECHRQLGHLRAAFRDLERAQELEPELDEVLLARTFAWIDARRPAAALSSIECFLARVPRHGYAILTRARLLQKVGRVRESTREYDRALAMLPCPEPDHFLEQATAHATLGARGKAKAITCLRRGVRLLGPVVSLIRLGRKLGVDLTRVSRAHAPTASIATNAPDMPIPTAMVGDTAVVRFGATWKYLDDGSDQGTRWRAPSFNDSSWKSGPAQLGYGDGDERTMVGFGNDPNNKHITTYFRHAFRVPRGVAIAQARVRLLRDDGVAVFLNGTEIARDNLPAGPIMNTTTASYLVQGPDESEVISIPFDARLLQAGTNVLAVEIHQFDPTSTDISHDLELRVSGGITTVERGPYLQQGGPTSAIVRWRTDYPASTVAFLGSSTTNLKPVVLSRTKTTEHTALIRGLKPDTSYYYAIGSIAGILSAGTDHKFTTAPSPGTRKRTRIWAIGDSGTADANAAAVRNAYETYAKGRPTDVWLMLGDNAYQWGTDSEYQRAVFDMYPKMLRSTFLWPTVGNHDAYTSAAAIQQGPYYDIFTLPKNAEMGGIASGTEAYYSFDHGDIHFVCLNSADSARTTTGAMLTWLAADLAASKSKWTIAYWHHPPYSKGSHDSDNPLEVGMTEMRQNVLPILEAGGVDLVLTGHSHSYERSFLLDGHYGTSRTLSSSMLLDQGDGRPGSHGAYTKPSSGRGANEGAVYIVAGSSGLISGGTLDHRAMMVSLNSLGSLVIDIDGDELEAKFLTEKGSVADTFTLRKGVVRTLRRDVPTLSIATGGSQTLTMDAGRAHANRAYILAGSLGTEPGFRLNGVHVPLNPDTWFRLSINHRNTSRFQNTFGSLDFKGTAIARLSFPPVNAPNVIGTRLHHAYVVYDSTGVRMASNPVSLTIIK